LRHLYGHLVQDILQPQHKPLSQATEAREEEGGALTLLLMNRIKSPTCSPPAVPRQVVP
jgi:hypothetical protein